MVYTGTHDNDTTAGWFSALSAREKKSVLRYLASTGDDIVWDLNRTAIASVADTAILPLQDVLGLPNDSRMNLPGTAGGNWSWRFRSGQLTGKLAKKLREVTELYGQAPCSLRSPRINYLDRNDVDYIVSCTIIFITKLLLMLPGIISCCCVGASSRRDNRAVGRSCRIRSSNERSCDDVRNEIQS